MKSMDRRRITMNPQYTYQSTLATAEGIRWRVEDLVGGDKRLAVRPPRGVALAVRGSAFQGIDLESGRLQEAAERPSHGEVVIHDADERFFQRRDLGIIVRNCPAGGHATKGVRSLGTRC
jgi:hypothetical protein